MSETGLSFSANGSQHRSILGRTTLVALVAGLALGSPAAHGATVPWGQEPIAYSVVDQDLRELLGEIGTRLGFRVRVSDSVKARVHGRFPPAPPREFIGRLAAIYGFEWFYDGGTLWISSPGESDTRMIPLGPVTLDQLRTTMDSLGASDDRFPLRGSGEAGVVVANGPPQFIAMVQQTVDALKGRAPVPASQVRVFNGN